MEIFKEFSFEAAHHLPAVPRDHKCYRLHGHTYTVGIFVSGPVDRDLGWVIDFAEITGAFESVREQLDHHYLNEIPGLDNPTCEVLAEWMWDRLSLALLGLTHIIVQETPTSGCIYRGRP